jgi:hypothetical protein
MEKSINGKVLHYNDGFSLSQLIALFFVYVNTLGVLLSSSQLFHGSL